MYPLDISYLRKIYFFTLVENLIFSSKPSRTLSLQNRLALHISTFTRRSALNQRPHFHIHPKATFSSSPHPKAALISFSSAKNPSPLQPSLQPSLLTHDDLHSPPPHSPSPHPSAGFTSSHPQKITAFFSSATLTAPSLQTHFPSLPVEDDLDSPPPHSHSLPDQDDLSVISDSNCRHRHFLHRRPIPKQPNHNRPILLLNHHKLSL
ncbi:hypothetical protein OIU76_011537 [Salix suchowensis]|nr:hypothetical protein OIU76_011537 [Salix suchowensis]